MTSGLAMADQLPAKEASKRIAQAVKVF